MGVISSFIARRAFTPLLGILSVDNEIAILIHTLPNHVDARNIQGDNNAIFHNLSPVKIT